jgi:hypothetical protein
MRAIYIVLVSFLMTAAATAQQSEPMLKVTKVYYPCCSSKPERSLYIQVMRDGSVTAEDDLKVGKYTRFTAKLKPATLQALQTQLEDPALAVLSASYPCFNTYTDTAIKMTLEFTPHGDWRAARRKQVNICNFFPVEEKFKDAYPPVLLRLACTVESLHSSVVFKTDKDYTPRGCALKTQQ